MDDLELTGIKLELILIETAYYAHCIFFRLFKFTVVMKRYSIELYSPIKLAYLFVSDDIFDAVAKRHEPGQTFPLQRDGGFVLDANYGEKIILRLI